VGIRRLGQYQKPNQLVLNTTPAFARHWLLPRLGDFRRQHPNVDLWIFSTDEVPDMATQTIDLAVRDDISSQAECSFKVLHADRLYPACHPSLLSVPSAQRTTLHGEREMDWSHWAVESGIDVGQQDQGLNFSDPGLLLDAACSGLGIALVSQLLSRQAQQNGLLQPLVEQTIRGPNWAMLTHRDSENDPMARCFSQWLSTQLAEPEPPAQTAVK
jgi:LysR family glycine cleavage system transcriptional activator